MLRKTRYANLLIDTVTRVSSAQSASERWNVICDIGGSIGANAVNAGAVSRQTRQPIWTVFNMDQEWLDEYAEAGLHQVDPVLSAVIKGNVPRVIEPRSGIPGAPTDNRKRQFDAGLARRGHNFCICLTENYADEERALVLISERDPIDLFGAGTGRAFQAISAVLLDSLVPPDAENGQLLQVNYAATLTGPERDILCHLAHGAEISEIANQMSMDEHMAQVLLRQSANKLGVKTGDQALATALARGLLPL